MMSRDTGRGQRGDSARSTVEDISGPIWAPAPRGPKLIRYLAWGECLPFVLSGCVILILGTAGNAMLAGYGFYGQSVFAAVMYGTLAFAFPFLILAQLCKDTWEPVGATGHDDQNKG